MLVFHHFSVLLKLKNTNPFTGKYEFNRTVKEIRCSFVVVRLFFYLSYGTVKLLSFPSSISQLGQDCSLGHKLLCFARNALNKERKCDLGADWEPGELHSVPWTVNFSKSLLGFMPPIKWDERHVHLLLVLPL